MLLNLFHIRKWNSKCVFTESPTDIFICNCMHKVIERVPSPQRLAGYLPAERRAGRRLFEENMRGEAAFFFILQVRGGTNGGGGTTVTEAGGPRRCRAVATDLSGERLFELQRVSTDPFI